VSIRRSANCAYESQERLCALTNIANVNAFGAIDADTGFEWKKMHAN
jgi:hypothetical protein